MGMHFPGDDANARRLAWGAMERLVDQRLVHRIGVSNFDVQQLEELLGYARIRPTILQTIFSPFHQGEVTRGSSSMELVQFCGQNGIQVLGFRSVQSYTVTFAESDGYTKTPGSLLRQQQRLLMDNPLLLRFARATGRTPTQVLLRWAMQRGIVPVVSSNSLERIEENVQSALGEDLPPHIMAVVDSLHALVANPANPALSRHEGVWSL